MNISKDELILILLILMGVVLAGELAYIMLRRKRRKQDMFRKKNEPAETVADRAHNLILTTESIAKTLSRQGINTYEADVLLRQAKTEEIAKDYSAAAERAEAAKLVLLRLKREHSARSQSVPSDPEKRPMDQSLYDTQDTPLTRDDAYDGTDDMLSSESKEEKDLDSLPTNYVQAKFMLSTTKDNLDNKGIKSGKAYELYAEAKKHFDAEDYSKALSNAIKADRLVDSGSVDLIAEEVYEEGEEIEVYVCPSCDSEVADDDVFCRECGQNLEEESGCPGCGEEVAANDKFCRKCGHKLK